VAFIALGDLGGEWLPLIVLVISQVSLRAPCFKGALGITTLRLMVAGAQLAEKALATNGRYPAAKLGGCTEEEGKDMRAKKAVRATHGKSGNDTKIGRQLGPKPACRARSETICESPAFSLLSFRGFKEGRDPLQLHNPRCHT